MNKEEAQKAIETLQDFIADKKMQYFSNSGDKWIDATIDNGADLALQWRVKPEPREFWLVRDESELFCVIKGGEACPNHWDEAIKVREVLDE